MNALRHATTSTFFALLAIGFIAHVAFIFSAGHHMNSDNAVVFLMAKHAAHGEVAAFYWGQSYGGTLLQLTAGTAMRVFGSTIEVMAITSVVFWAAAAIFLRLIVLRSVGRSAGDIAGVLFWFPGLVIFSWSTAGDGFYGPTLMLAFAAIWLTLRMPWSRGWTGWLGLGTLLGLSLWTSAMAFVMVIPAALAAAGRDRSLRRWLLGGAAAIIAGLPWLIEAARGSLSTVNPHQGAQLHLSSFAAIFTDLLPAAFPLSDHQPVRLIVAVASVSALTALLFFGVRRRNLGAILIGSGSVLVIIVLVLGSGLRLARDSARYSSFLLPGLAFAIAWLVTRYSRLQWLALLVAPAVTLGLVAQESQSFRFSTEARFDPALMKVAGKLESNGISAAYGDYWMSYAASAATDEKITVAALRPRRYRGYEEAAARSSPMAIIVFADRENDKMLQSRRGVPRFTRSVIGRYAVYLFDRWFDPFTLPLHIF
jgi:hypothetical protein